MNVGKGLKTLRKKKGLTKFELAEKLGKFYDCKISEDEITNLENLEVIEKIIIKDLLEVLESSKALLAWYSVDEDDVDVGKKSLYNELKGLVNNVLDDHLKNENICKCKDDPCWPVNGECINCNKKIK